MRKVTIKNNPGNTLNYWDNAMNYLRGTDQVLNPCLDTNCHSNCVGHVPCHLLIRGYWIILDEHIIPKKTYALPDYL